MSVFRRIQIVAAVFIAAAGITAWAFSASLIAGASASFTPSLEPAQHSKITLAVSNDEPVAAFSPQEKRLARVTSSPANSKAPQSRPTYTTSSGGRNSALAQAVATKSPSAPQTEGDKLARAQALLDEQIAKYPILEGVTVSFGDARGHQAIAYYTTGRIVISPNHTAPLEKIIAHEVWHIIDWRTNGKILWGENIPR